MPALQVPQFPPLLRPRPTSDGCQASGRVCQPMPHDSTPTTMAAPDIWRIAAEISGYLVRPFRRRQFKRRAGGTSGSAYPAERSACEPSWAATVRHRPRNHTPSQLPGGRSGKRYSRISNECGDICGDSRLDTKLCGVPVSFVAHNARRGIPRGTYPARVMCVWWPPPMCAPGRTAGSVVST